MSEKNNKNGSSGIYVAVFFLCVIMIIILFFVKKNEIVGNLKRTNFFERVGVPTPEFVQNHKVDEPEVLDVDVEIDLLGGEGSVSKDWTSPSESDSSKSEGKTLEQIIVDAAASKIAEVVSEKIDESKSSVVEKKPEIKEQAPKVVASTRKTTLYFVTIESDGSVNRKAVVRDLPKSDSPLTDAIKALLSGPVAGEKNCMNLIPNGTRLIGASVKDGVAVLNFNETFEFNSYGVEGCIGQLMQIVYTATEFSTVKSVQFLIEGEKKEYLGTEGQWIGTPLSRSSF